MDPIDNPQNYKYGIFYYNKGDVRTIVRKRSRLGWTFNFAHWQSYVALGLVIVVVLCRMFLR